MCGSKNLLVIQCDAQDRGNNNNNQNNVQVWSSDDLDSLLPQLDSSIIDEQTMIEHIINDTTSSATSTIKDLPCDDGRDRSMSFDVFSSLGINPEEGLLIDDGDTTTTRPDLMLSSSTTTFPDEDTITSSARRETRTYSIGLTNDEMDIMNALYFTTTPAATTTNTTSSLSGSEEAVDDQMTCTTTDSILLPDIVTSKLTPTTPQSTTKTGTRTAPRTTTATSPSSLSQTLLLSKQLTMEELLSQLSFQKLEELVNKDGRVGMYFPVQRKARIAKFHLKRKRRVWRKKIRYGCRQKLASNRIRIKGRFVKTK